jgi:hypothetical protein
MTTTKVNVILKDAKDWLEWIHEHRLYRHGQKRHRVAVESLIKIRFEGVRVTSDKRQQARYVQTWDNDNFKWHFERS